MPWAAPAFDHRQVTSDPQLVCASAGAGEDVAALGATQFVAVKTKSHIVYGLLVLGYMALLFYAYAIFSARIRLPLIKTKHHREFVSGMIALALAYLTSVIAQNAVSAFSLSAL